MVKNMLAETLMRLPDVSRCVGYRRSMIYRLIDEKRFPKPLKLGRVSVWRKTEIERWISDRIADAVTG